MKKVILIVTSFIVFSSISTAYCQEQTSTYLTIEAQVIKYDNKDCKGSFEIFTTEGIHPFTYSNDGGKTFQSSKIFENLCEGKYFIQAKDATGKLGLTFIDLSPNSSQIIFSEAEQEAIKNNTIKELLNEREAVMNDWKKRSVIEYKLSKFGITYPPIIENKNQNNDTITLTYKFIAPENINVNILYDHYNRMLTEFKDSFIDIKTDFANLTTTLYYKITVSENILNEYFFLNGFSKFN